MKDASEYLIDVRSLILLNDLVQHWQIIREEAQVDRGVLRYRLQLSNQDILDIFERFIIANEQVTITRYSYHWQRSNQEFVKRWDNAPHYPTLVTYPHHVHDGSEDHVLSHPSVKLTDVLIIIRQLIT